MHTLRFIYKDIFKNPASIFFLKFSDKYSLKCFYFVLGLILHVLSFMKQNIIFFFQITSYLQAGTLEGFVYFFWKNCLEFFL